MLRTVLRSHLRTSLAVSLLGGTLLVGPMVGAQEPTGATPPAADEVANNKDVRISSETLDDGKVLEVTHVANAGEIAQAQMAGVRSTNPQVKKLAKMIVADHTQAQKDGTRVARERNIAPADSGISKDLKTDGDKTLADLGSKNGDAFDRAYVDAQVKQHQAVLRLIDNKLLPSATDPDVKALVTRIRPHIQMHLDQAKALQTAMKK